jgi:urea transport system substrate-binding protein
MLLIVAVALSACTGASVNPPAPQFSGPPIRIGLLHSLSGTLALSEVPVRNAALLAIDEINAQGGVLGRKIEWIVADGESDPAVFAREAERLIAEEEVVALFGCWTSVSRKAVLPIVEAANSLLWYPVQYEGLEQSPNIFYLGATTNQQLIPAVEYLVAQGKRRFFLLGSDYIFPQTANAIARAQLADNGATVVGELYVALGSRQFADVIATIQASGADVVLNTLNGDSNVAFFQQLEAAGIDADTLPTLSVSIAEPEVRAIGAERMVGHLTAWNYFQSTSTEANRAFVAAYRARYGERQVLSDPMEAMYIGVYLWAAAVERAGTLETDAVRTAAHDLAFAAPGGPVTLDGTTQHLAKTARIGRITPSGQIEEIWRSPAPIEPDPFLTTYSWANELRP